jgi:putative transposase
MARRPPSQQLAQLAEHLDRETDVNDLTSELVRLGARKLIQELLEAEVTEVVGRERYARRDPEVHGYRNGYKRRLDTAEGWVPVDAPRSATTAEPFRSTLWPALKTRRMPWPT